MKAKWLGLILSLTNRIYSKQHEIIHGVGLGTIGNILSLIVMEFLLAAISLPLYIGLRSVSVTAYLEEKGGYGEITSDYNLRRVLTLTSVGVVFVIWIIKLLLITVPPAALGPLQLYSVSTPQPVDILQNSVVVTETQIQTARVIDTIKRPELTEVKKKEVGTIFFMAKVNRKL